MDFFLSNIDSQIMQQVKSLTASNVINRKKEVYIHKDETHREKGKDNRKNGKDEIRRRIQELNNLIEERKIGIYLLLEENEDEDILMIKVMDKNTDTCIKMFNEFELEKLINSLQDVMGIIVDIRI